ncbi:hypothetical protein [Sulfurovum sp. NBC37-1]|uniref:hypothetical protein n=1 Tax=Sulfurovum sp. (strain NBC37-1) TaxID=387093 RepID=UPI0011D12DB9|nr:hypothetical protein [Sulfurovum sp. NBC37-1]
MSELYHNSRALSNLPSKKIAKTLMGSALVAPHHTSGCPIYPVMEALFTTHVALTLTHFSMSLMGTSRLGFSIALILSYG